MNPCSFHLTQAQACELQSAYLCDQNPQTKTRFQAVRLYGTGDCSHQSEDICACSPRSLLRGCQSYRDRGITALCDGRIGGNRARLTPQQIEAVRNQLHTYTPAQLSGQADCGGEGLFWTLADLAVLLKRDCAVTYRNLLAKCSFSYQRPAKQYKSHSEAKLREFEETLEKIVGLAQNAPNTVILAEAEASLYLQASLRRVWAPTGQTPVIRGGGRAKRSRCAPI